MGKKSRKKKSGRNQPTIKAKLKDLLQTAWGLIIILFIVWVALDQLGIIRFTQNMTHRIVEIAFPGQYQGFQVPDRQGVVTDLANVISNKDEAHIASIAEELKEKTGVEMAVLTINSLNGYPLEETSVKVAKTWGLGDQKSDKGLLILVAVKDRRMRTEIGYGLEGDLTDSASGSIQDDAMIPYFKDNSYSQGIASGVNAYALHIAGANQVKLDQAADEDDFVDNAIDLMSILFAFLLLLGVSVWFLWLLFTGKGGGSGDDDGSGSSDSDGGDSSDYGGGDFGGGGSSRDW